MAHVVEQYVVLPLRHPRLLLLDGGMDEMTATRRVR